MVLGVLQLDDLGISLKVSLANIAADSEMKCIIEMFLLASAHKTPASQTEKAANGDWSSSEDYVNVACDLDKNLREHECSVRWLRCQLEPVH